MGYLDRVVAFVDILGFKSIVHRMDDEPGLFEAVQDALSYIRAIATYIDGVGGSDDVKMTSFSDCSVLSAKPGSALFVAQTASHLASRMLEIGLMTRGGIAIGRLYHDDQIVFGQGLVDAYEIESKAALYPRVVAADRVRAEIVAQEGVADEPTRSILKRGYDGLYYLDPFWHEDSEKTHTERMKKIRRHLLGYLRKKNSDHLHLGQLAKLRWLVRELNESVRALPESGALAIDLDDPV